MIYSLFEDANCFYRSLFSYNRFRANISVSMAIASSTFLYPSWLSISTISGLGILLFLNADIIYKYFSSSIFIGKKLSQLFWVKALIFSSLFLIAIFSVVIGIADPAHAAFLSGAETWMVKALGVEGDSISIVFNILRAILILYIVIALVMVLQKVQQGDDWQTMARIPLMVVGVVFMGDILVGMVIGETGSDPDEG